MVRAMRKISALIRRLTYDNMLAAAHREIDDLRRECHMLEFERSIARHETAVAVAQLSDVSAGVADLQRALDEAEAKLAA